MSRAKAAPKKKAVPAESPVKVKAEETKKVSEAKEEKPKAAKSASPSPAKPTKKRAASAGPSKAESAPSPAKKQKAPAKAAKPKAEPVDADADAKEASPVQPRKRKQPSRGADAAEAPAEPAADVPSSPAPAKKAKPKAKSPAASRAKKQPAKEAAAKTPEVAEPETNGDAESKTPAKAAKGGAKGKGKKAAAEESVKEAQVVADALFDNEDDSDSEFEGLEDEDADAKQVVLTEAQLSELPSIGKAKALAVKSRLSEAKGAGRGVIYLGHIPHGFFEDQMRGFFTQFGTITRLRLSRSKKTGRSRGYAFIEFETPEVAEIVAETMNNYMMFGRSLKCHVVRPEQLHADTFKGANKKFRRVPWARLAREQMNKSRTPEQQKKRVSRLQKKDNERRAKLAAMGISYQFEGYTQNGSKVEAAAEKAVASKESKPKAKAAPTKSKKAA